jgi:hypothetical protein
MIVSLSAANIRKIDVWNDVWMYLISESRILLEGVRETNEPCLGELFSKEADSKSKNSNYQPCSDFNAQNKLTGYWAQIVLAPIHSGRWEYQGDLSP